MFEYGDLDPEEAALLALEHVRATARWLAQAAHDDVVDDETARVFGTAAEATHDFARELELVLEERVDATVPQPTDLITRLHRRPDLLTFTDDGPEVSPQDLFEIACTEQEEAYEFFLGEADGLDDPWLKAVFEEITRHARGVLLYLEEQREALIDREGA